MKTHLLLLTLFFLNAIAAFSQTASFNFQGRLNDGPNPANGNYDLRFKLYNAITDGDQIGSTNNRVNTPLVNGVFSTTLSFGPTAFRTDEARFLEISLRPSGSSNSYVILGARQQILTVPFAAHAIRANLATDATNAENAVNATNAVNAQNAAKAATAQTAQNSESLGGVAAAGYARLSFANQGDVSATNLGAAGYLSVGGNTIQPGTSTGLVKAMITVNFSGQLVRCFNGVTGQSAGDCGFTVTRALTGVHHINFGFPVSNRFISVSVQNVFGGELRNHGVNYRFNSNNLEVFTFYTDDRSNTVNQEFTAIVF